MKIVLTASELDIINDIINNDVKVENFDTGTGLEVSFEHVIGVDDNYRTLTLKHDRHYKFDEMSTVKFTVEITDTPYGIYEWLETIVAKIYTGEDAHMSVKDSFKAVTKVEDVKLNKEQFIEHDGFEENEKELCPKCEGSVNRHKEYEDPMYGSYYQVFCCDNTECDYAYYYSPAETGVEGDSIKRVVSKQEVFSNLDI